MCLAGQRVMGVRQAAGGGGGGLTGGCSLKGSAGGLTGLWSPEHQGPRHE